MQNKLRQETNIGSSNELDFTGGISLVNHVDPHPKVTQTRASSQCEVDATVVHKQRQYKSQNILNLKGDVKL